MCGIFGFTMKPNAMTDGQRLILAYELTRHNDDRGGHSWGFAVDKTGSGDVVCERGLGEGAPEAHRVLGARTLIGHTRWATHGDKTVDNAHPFTVGRIVGAHNGIIYNHSDLNKKYERTFECDSQHIFAHLDAGLSLSEFEGYGSIEWFDRSRPGAVNLCRMRRGELAIAGIGEDPKNPDGVVWSSDDEHLEKALDAVGVQHFNYRVEEGHVYRAREDGLYTTEEKILIAEGASRVTWRDFTLPKIGSGDGASLAGWPDEDTGERRFDLPGFERGDDGVWRKSKKNNPDELEWIDCKKCNDIIHIEDPVCVSCGTVVDDEIVEERYRQIMLAEETAEDEYVRFARGRR